MYVWNCILFAATLVTIIMGKRKLFRTIIFYLLGGFGATVAGGLLGMTFCVGARQGASIGALLWQVTWLGCSIMMIFNKKDK